MTSSALRPPRSPNVGQTPHDFFRGLYRAFDGLLQASVPAVAKVAGLTGLAADSFQGNVRMMRQDEPPLACHRGCATCCTLRVGATAPEVLQVARFLRLVGPRLRSRGVDLVAQVRDADALTRGADEVQRVQMRRACPFVARGVCIIYEARPLACRGHTSHDVKACVDAAAGRRSDVPFSQSHQWVRAMVQNALQASVRAAGLAWGMYELNQGVLLTLDHADPEGAWLRGEDPLAAALLPDLPLQDMAQAFDQLLAPD